jgi:hypothetical protein
MRLAQCTTCILVASKKGNALNSIVLKGMTISMMLKTPTALKNQMVDVTTPLWTDAAHKMVFAILTLVLQALYRPLEPTKLYAMGGLVPMLTKESVAMKWHYVLLTNALNILQTRCTI